MTSTPHHLASMSSDEPRGYGVRGDVRKRLEEPTETESVTAKVSEMSIDFRDYTPEARALYEGTHMFVGVHVPIKYAKNLTLATFVNVEIDVAGDAS